MSDTIYRQDAIDTLEQLWDWESVDGIQTSTALQQVIQDIKNLPFAQRKGHWIDRSDGGRIVYPWYETHECNQCGHEGSGAWEYCPRCGAEMEEN